MHKKIFRSFLIMAIIVIISSFVMTIGILFDYFQSQLEQELKNEAMYIASAIENEGAGYLDSVANDEKRITLISADGTVIADTSVEADRLENHLDREEIKKAIKNGCGTSVRYSETLTEKTIYYAQTLKDGSILRISAKQYTVIIVLLGLSQPIAVVVIITLILSFVLSSRVSKNIVNPINEIDLENPENNNTYEELSPLLSKISSQHKTIQKQLYDAKKQQEEFALITENMSEGLLVIDKNMQILICNTSAKKLLNSGENVNNNVFSVNRSKVFRQSVEKSLIGEHFENEMVSDDRHYNIISNPVYENSEIIGAFIVIIDITEKIQRENMRREFTSNVSHELKTPLTSISGFAEMMMNGGVDEITVKDFSKSIYDEAQRLISLVIDIIRISELDEKNNIFIKEDVDLYGLSEEIAERLKSQADKKSIEINVIGEEVQIYGVRKILDEIIYNLCDNAIKYNNDSGKVDIIIKNTDNEVILTVRDNGIGIPENSQNRIFERFYRVDKSRSKEKGGTGLGLSIVKHGALFHNAKITLESQINKGTSITIKFPKQ
ncbi:MAG: ATP-binding protein [Ruminococcus flavefaciens]|nr:ATP-binding protein [Ruminococcus flavefaciens]MCM1228698.1 ATP-binding protein [Ruminococcus flavefaciens]